MDRCNSHIVLADLGEAPGALLGAMCWYLGWLWEGSGRGGGIVGHWVLDQCKQKPGPSPSAGEGPGLQDNEEVYPPPPTTTTQ